MHDLFRLPVIQLNISSVWHTYLLTCQLVNPLTNNSANGLAYKCMTPRLHYTHNDTPFRSIYRFNANCLHSALFVCNALIFKRFRRVDNSEFYLHAVCTQLHSCLHLFALVCTIYVACTYQHRYKCTRVVPTTHYGIGGALFRLLRRKKRSPYAVASGWHDRFCASTWLAVFAC